MIVAVSPYHLTSREPPAMASLLLASRAVTFMPGVGVAGSDASVVSGAARKSPRYRRFMESWHWSLPLWQDGSLTSAIDGDDAASDVRSVWDRVCADDRYLQLRRFMRPGLVDDPDRLLDAVATDVLKGGPDPAISVPLAAALDRFATRHHVAVARASAVSVAQKAETSLAHTLSTVVLPVLLQASGERVVLARERLAPQLADLRHVLDSFTRGERPQRTALNAAASRYQHAFEAHASEFTAAQDKDEARVVLAPVSLTIAEMPTDAVLRSSTTAAAALTPRRLTAAMTPAQPTTLPALADIADHGRFISLIVRAVGR